MELREQMREQFVKMLDSMEERAEAAKMEAQEWVDILSDMADEIDLRIEEYAGDEDDADEDGEG